MCVPVQTGVTMFSCHSSGNGTDQSELPVFASLPSIDLLVSVRICLEPPMVTTTGEAYPGPLPVHVQRSAPVCGSSAMTRPPLTSLPTWTITDPPSASGDAAVPVNSLDVSTEAE